MDYAKLITELCAIIERQNLILKAQAMALAQLDALSYEDEIKPLYRRYAEVMGERGADNDGI